VLRTSEIGVNHAPAVGPMSNELGDEPCLTLLRPKPAGLRPIKRAHWIASVLANDLLCVSCENEEREARAGARLIVNSLHGHLFCILVHRGLLFRLEVSDCSLECSIFTAHQESLRLKVAGTRPRGRHRREDPGG
jgi:hypothetical protein